MVTTKGRNSLGVLKREGDDSLEGWLRWSKESICRLGAISADLAHMPPRCRALALRVIEHFSALTPGEYGRPTRTDDGGVALEWESDTSGREVVVAIPPDGAWAYVGGTDCGETYTLRTLDDAALDKAALWLWGLSNTWPGDEGEGRTGA